MIIMQCWPLDVFRPGTLIKPVKFGADRTFYGLVTTTSIPMARHRTCHATRDTPFNENSRSSQFNITKAF